ncbi:hypothetical protein MTO96_034990 [Rhipicephalus appendiculatus]
MNVQARKRCSPRCVQQPPASHGAPGYAPDHSVTPNNQLGRRPAAPEAPVLGKRASSKSGGSSRRWQHLFRWSPLPFADTAQRRRIDRGAERAALPFTQMSLLARRSGCCQTLLPRARYTPLCGEECSSSAAPCDRRRCKFIAPTIALRTRSPGFQARRTPDTVLTCFHCRAAGAPLRTPTQAARIRRSLAETGSCYLATSPLNHPLLGLRLPGSHNHPITGGADEVRSGKSWSKDELRIKSNSDLHKLWYILLKEKNMLLTMEEAAKQEVELFPNPERIDKVKESMNNLEEVVRGTQRGLQLA